MTEVKVFRRYDSRRDKIMEYRATYEDGELIKLVNVTTGSDIPLITDTAKVIRNVKSKRHCRLITEAEWQERQLSRNVFGVWSHEREPAGIRR